ncbi:hypothetical protein SCA6_013955 [Theobroma cacao]
MEREIHQVKLSFSLSFGKIHLWSSAQHHLSERTNAKKETKLQVDSRVLREMYYVLLILRNREQYKLKELELKKELRTFLGLRFCSDDCTKHDPEVSEDTEKNFADLLTEELKLREAETLESQQRADMALLEAKKIASQYQKEADKCNSGMETCEEAREKAEAALAAQKKLTTMWELRARQKGWREGVTNSRTQSQGENKEKLDYETCLLVKTLLFSTCRCFLVLLSCENFLKHWYFIPTRWVDSASDFSKMLIDYVSINKSNVRWQLYEDFSLFVLTLGALGNGRQARWASLRFYII